MGFESLQLPTGIRPACAAALLLVLVSAAQCQASDAKCDFGAIFNFGDSNSDTGGFWAAFPAQSGPFGMTYFRKPVGRASDGRLVVDFLAHALGLPFLSPYLKSVGSDYRHGVNYATLASTVLLPNTSLFVSGISPFSLAIQLNQMKYFKTLVLEYGPKGNLPPKDIFGRSFYTIDIGQNDFTSNLKAIGIEGVKQYFPQVVSQISETIKELYGLGGRTFLVSNLGPIGCYPAFLTELPHAPNDLDIYGCMTSYNKEVDDYNVMLKETLSKTRVLLRDASIVYVDTYTVKLDLFRHPKLHGMFYATHACCGYGGGRYNYNPQLYCGNSKVINGSTVTASACSDPEQHVSWDGIHFTEQSNKYVTWAILNGSYSDPPYPLSKYCDLQPIG